MAGGLDVDIRENMRGACPYPGCGSTMITVRQKGPQVVAHCAGCKEYLFCPSKDELGLPKRRVSTTREDLSPTVEQAVFTRDGWRCMVCGRRPSAEIFLHVGHILSVKDGMLPEPRLAEPLTASELNDPANLITLCEAHNLGMGSRSLEPRIGVVLLLRDIAHRERKGKT